MASHVLDHVGLTEKTLVCDDPLITVSGVEVSPEAVVRLLRSSRPILPGVKAAVMPVRGRRSIPPASGHALEKLGHAIEYVTDTYIHEGCEGGFSSSRIGAIQILMSLNREIYYECPILLSLSARIRASLHRAIGD